MKLKLINPQAQKLIGKNSSRSRLPPWALTVLAAYTPDEVDVSILDEMIEKIDFDEPADLVGITAITASVQRAYEIADEYRSRGVAVVMGGFHVSAMPDECLQHADAVVIGEPENIWQDVLNDFSNGKMKGIYKSEEPVDLENMLYPRLDLVRYPEKYAIFQFIQTTRGCPYKCEFCSCQPFYGRKYRHRPIDEVVEEIKHLDNRKPIYLVDDHIAAVPRYTKELLRRLIPLNITWGGQTGFRTAFDAELMDLLKRSGCKMLFVGFESLETESLQLSNKKHNKPEQYKESIRLFHQYGISVHGGFVMGLDGDGPDVFKKIDSFINESDMDTAQFNILYPYPGSQVRERLIKEHRLTSNDYKNYIFDGVNFLPKKMTQKELHNGYVWLLKRNSSYFIILKRTIKAFLKTKLAGALGTFKQNLGIRRQFKQILLNQKNYNPISASKQYNELKN